MAAKISRFDIHDELTAPPESAPILKGALSGSGKLNNFVGVLAGSPAALRGYARMRSELRRGTLPPATQERIALAVAEYRGSEYDVAVHARAGRSRRARAWTRSTSRGGSPPATSARPRCCATSRRCSRTAAQVPVHLHEEAREHGWTDEQILEALGACGARGLLVARNACR